LTHRLAVVFHLHGRAVGRSIIMLLCLFVCLGVSLALIVPVSD
jgi:hypothetical protein